MHIIVQVIPHSTTSMYVLVLGLSLSASVLTPALIVFVTMVQVGHVSSCRCVECMCVIIHVCLVIVCLSVCLCP